MKKLRINPSSLAGGGGRKLLQRGAVLLTVLFSFGMAFLYVRHFGYYNANYTPDEGHYIDMARRILTEHVYSYWGEGPDAYVSFGYPLFLAAGMAVFGTGLNGLLCIKMIQCMLAAGTVFLTCLLGRMLTGRFSVGLIASILVAAATPYYLYSAKLLTETLYFFAMMLFFVVFLWACQGEKLWRYGLSGALFALAVMVRPLIIVTLPFLFLPGLAQNRKQPRKVAFPLLLFLAGFGAVCLPWWIRNLVTLRQFIPLATQTNPIYAGLAPNPDAMGLTDPGSFAGNLKLLFRLIAEDPVGTLYWMTFGKFYVLFMEDIVMEPQIIVSFIRNITVYPGFFGALRSLFSKRYWGPSLVFWVYLAASFLFIPVYRYSLQYLPMLAIFAAQLLVSAFPHWTEGAP